VPGRRAARRRALALASAVLAGLSACRPAPPGRPDLPGARDLVQLPRRWRGGEQHDPRGSGGFRTGGSGHAQAFVVSEKNGAWAKVGEVPGSGTLNKGGSARTISVSFAPRRVTAAPAGPAKMARAVSRSSWSARRPHLGHREGGPGQRDAEQGRDCRKPLGVVYVEACPVPKLGLTAGRACRPGTAGRLRHPRGPGRSTKPRDVIARTFVLAPAQQDALRNRAVTRQPGGHSRRAAHPRPGGGPHRAGSTPAARRSRRLIQPRPEPPRPHRTG